MVLYNSLGRGLRQAMAAGAREVEARQSSFRYVLPPEVPEFSTNGPEQELRSSLALDNIVLTINAGLSSSVLSDETKDAFRERLVETLVAVQDHPYLQAELSAARRRSGEILSDLVKVDAQFSQALRSRAPEVISALMAKSPDIGRDGFAPGL